MLITLFSASSHAESSAAKPKLILQITVDQFRGDLPTRYYERLGEGGFKYLWETGIVYRDAHHAHANTETIVGHATLATIDRRVLTIDIAPTLTAYLGIKPPSGSQGTPLTEVLVDRN